MIDTAVVDASVAVKWVVAEPDSEAAVALTGAALTAPDLLLPECANVLWKRISRGELAVDEALLAVHALAMAPVTIVPSRDILADALRLSAALDHPVYDCLYLALASRDSVPLVTADRRFADSAWRDARVGPLIRLLGEPLT